MRLRARGISALLTLILLITPACDRVDNAEHQEALRTLVSDTPDWVGNDKPSKRLWQIARAFYDSRQHMPAWVDGDRTTDHMRDLIQQLRYSEKHGLTPAAYGVEEFERLREESQTSLRGTRFPLDQVPELDAKLTFAYLRYAADLLGWNSSSRDVVPTWRTEERKEDLAARLTAAVTNNTVRESLEELAPAHPQYKGLQAALAREQDNASGRAALIRLNLERWRWAPRDLGDRYVLINVPSYQMQVMEGDSPVLAMRIIVGKPDTPTPLFSDEMTYVVFSPYWNIPESILRDETLPRLVNDPDYLRRNNIEVVNGGEIIDASMVDWSDDESTAGLRFRQGPGPENALGLVKFIFPNNFSVYLHDTPTDRLFFRERRTFSHGCIRIEQPVELAKYVLGDQPEWTEPRIRAAMSAGREQTARLKRPLPVHIGYWTAWVESDGTTVTFSDDPYGIDIRHARVRDVDVSDARPAE